MKVKTIVALDDYWFDRPDVEKFTEALEKMGFSWEIVDLEKSPTMRIWKPTQNNHLRIQSLHK